MERFKSRLVKKIHYVGYSLEINLKSSYIDKIQSPHKIILWPINAISAVILGGSETLWEVIQLLKSKAGSTILTTPLLKRLLVVNHTSTY